MDGAAKKMAHCPLGMVGRSVGERGVDLKGARLRCGDAKPIVLKMGEEAIGEHGVPFTGSLVP